MSLSIRSKYVLYSFPILKKLADSLCSLPNFEKGEWKLDHFANDEVYIKLRNNPQGNQCIVLSSLTPPEHDIFSFLLLCHTLKEEGANKVTALLPYLAYSRQEKKEALKSRATALIGQLFMGAGIDEILTVDVHSEDAIKLFPMKLISLSSAAIFSGEIITQNMQDSIIVAPDEGSEGRCKEIAEQVGTNKIISMVKVRTEKGIRHLDVIGEFYRHENKPAIIIDDMLDTGKTLISCCERLQERGVEKIFIMVTHGLFTGKDWETLWSLGVQRIYCTDSVPLPKHAHNSKIKILSIIPLVENYLLRDSL